MRAISPLLCHHCSYASRLWLTQHGDLVEEEVLRGMDERTQEELIRMLDLGFSGLAQLDRSAIVICHSVPGAAAACRCCSFLVCKFATVADHQCRPAS